MIQAIVFDIGGVIREQTWSGLVAPVVAEATGADIAAVKARIKEIRPALARGDITVAEFFDRLAAAGKRVPSGTEEATLNRAWESATINQEILSLLDGLQRNGYRLAALTNTDPVFADHYRKTGIIGRFNVAVLSCEVGAVKPEERAYRVLLDCLRLRPEECLFVDDSEENLKAAAALGFATIFYRGAGQLRSDLQTAGIRC